MNCLVVHKIKYKLFSPTSQLGEREINVLSAHVDFHLSFIIKLCRRHFKVRVTSLLVNN